MNICFITYGHVSPIRGGVDRVTDIVARSLQARKHKVLLVSACQPAQNDILNSNQYVMPTDKIEDEKNIEFLHNFFANHSIEVIVNQCERQSILHLLQQTHGNIPIVTAFHGDPRAPVKGIRDAWDWRMMQHSALARWLLSPYYLLRCVVQYYLRSRWQHTSHNNTFAMSDAVVLLSENFKKPYAHCVGISPSHPRLFAISNPQHMAEVTIPEIKEKRILWVARHDFSPKRLDRLIRVWSQIANHRGWHLDILGSGTHTAFYQQLAQKIGTRDISFHGTVSPESFYQKAQILCVTSTHEGLPMVLLEALNFEVIPVAFQSYESITDIIRTGENGFLIPPFDEKQMQYQLEQLMDDGELRQKLRERIRKDTAGINRFNPEIIASQWEQLLNKVTINE